MVRFRSLNRGLDWQLRQITLAGMARFTILLIVPRAAIMARRRSCVYGMLYALLGETRCCATALALPAFVSCRTSDILIHAVSLTRFPRW